MSDKAIESVHPDQEIEVFPPLKDIIQKVRRDGKLQKLSVSKSYQTREGNIFTSRTVSYGSIDQHGNEVGGLDELEASIAVQVVSAQVDKDSIIRARISGYISEQQKETYIEETSLKHARAIREIYEKVQNG